MRLYQPGSSEETVQLLVKHQQPVDGFTLAGTRTHSTWFWRPVPDPLGHWWLHRVYGKQCNEKR